MYTTHLFKDTYCMYMQNTPLNVHDTIVPRNICTRKTRFFLMYMTHLFKGTCVHKHSFKCTWHICSKEHMYTQNTLNIHDISVQRNICARKTRVNCTQHICPKDYVYAQNTPLNVHDTFIQRNFCSQDICTQTRFSVSYLIHTT